MRNTQQSIYRIALLIFVEENCDLKFDFRRYSYIEFISNNFWIIVHIIRNKDAKSLDKLNYDQYLIIFL